MSLCSAMAIAESSREPGFGEDNVGGAPYHPLAHSNSTGSFSSSSSSGAMAAAAAAGHHHHHHQQQQHSRHSSQRTQL